MGWRLAIARDRHTVSKCSQDDLPPVARRSPSLPPPEHAVEMADIPVSNPARHLVDRCARLLEQFFGDLQATSGQKPFQAEAGDALEDPAQMRSAHAGRLGDP